MEELVSFGLVGVISIFLAAKFLTISAISEIPPAIIPWWQLLLAFGIGTAVILGLIRIVHGGRFLRFFFYFALFSGAWITFSAILSDAAAFFVSVVLVAAYIAAPYVWLHNLVLILTLSGIAGLIGSSFSPKSVIILLVIMSIYDYVAVYKTKHMVKMAKAMIAGRAIFAMIFPEHWRGFKARLSEARPGEGFMMLGTGDFVFPLVLASSALQTSRLAAWTVFIFSLAGLLIMHLIFMSQKIRRPMPALPPLAAAAILGFIVSTLIK